MNIFGRKYQIIKQRSTTYIHVQMHMHESTNYKILIQKKKFHAREHNFSHISQEGT